MDLTFTVGLAIGLLIGWLIEMIIDYFYWRGGSQRSQLRDVEMSLATANQHLSALDAELNEATTSNIALNQALNEANRELETLRAQLAAQPLETVDADTEASRNKQPDLPPSELEQISGIGKVYAGKLREAGIDSFGQFVGLTPEDVVEIIQPNSGEFVDAAAWLAQARELVQAQTEAFAVAAANVGTGGIPVLQSSEFAAAAANVATGGREHHDEEPASTSDFAAAAAQVEAGREA